MINTVKVDALTALAAIALAAFTALRPSCFCSRCRRLR
ncbi:hypothetical protein C4K25_2443 [Pseudomonas chlororaphis]|nr:hypothetical protein C4K25_2443 [Pseudomonas chlororaphis]